MKLSIPRGKQPGSVPALVSADEKRAFAEVVEMIRVSRGRALTAVNSALIDLYWNVG
jgi:hypothetical protein